MTDSQSKGDWTSRCVAASFIMKLDGEGLHIALFSRSSKVSTYR